MKYITKEDITQEPNTIFVDECYTVKGTWATYKRQEFKLENVTELDVSLQYKHRLFLVNYEDQLELWRCLR